MAKQRRVRRAYMKMYSAGYINTGRGPNPIVLAQYHERAKLAGVHDEWLETAFPGVKSLDTPDKVFSKAEQGVPRAIVLAKLIRGGQTYEQPLNYVKMLDGRFEKIRLYFGGETCFFLRRLTKGAVTIIWTSLLYPSTTSAKRDYGYGRVVWVQPPMEIPTPSADRHSE